MARIHGCYRGDAYELFHVDVGGLMTNSDRGRGSVDGFIPAGVHILFSRPGLHSEDSTDRKTSETNKHSHNIVIHFSMRHIL